LEARGIYFDKLKVGTQPLPDEEINGVKTRDERLQDIQDILDAMGDYDVDSVGSVIKRKALSTMADYDFSLGRVDVREYQRKLAIEAGAEEHIASVDTSETLKQKTKQESFH